MSTTGDRRLRNETGKVAGVADPQLEGLCMVSWGELVSWEVSVHANVFMASCLVLVFSELLWECPVHTLF